MRTLDYHALPGQYRFLHSRAQYAGLFGGIGSGKSHAGCFWAMLKALRNPRALGLIGANSYRQLEDATLRTFRAHLEGYGVPYRYLASDARFRLGNGAEILCRSLENYDALRGVELGWFYLDELRDTRLEAWRVVQGRLRGQDVDAREGRVTSSPNGFNWIYDEFVRRASAPLEPRERGRYEAFFARTRDNYHLPEDYVAALLGSYDPLLAAQELDGRFINTTAGRIYHAFDRTLHVTEAAEFLPGEPVLWALDFNVSPMTAVIAQLEPSFVAPPSGGSSEDRVNAEQRTALRVVDELWLTDSGTLAMCEAFGQWLERRGCHPQRASVEGALRGRPRRHPQARTLEGGTRRDGASAAAIRVYGDAAGNARSTAAGRSDYAIIRQCFPRAVFCVPGANPARRDRYNAVNAAFCDALGRVRLRIHPRCRHLLADLEEMTYQPHTSLPDTSNPERGHISDALGYLVARLLPAGSAACQAGKW